MGLSSFFSLSQLGRLSSHHFADSHSSMHLAIFVSISCLERLLPKNSRKWPSGSMRYLWRGGEGAVADTEAAEVAEKEVE